MDYKSCLFNRSFATSGVNISPYIPSMMASFENWTKRDEIRNIRQEQKRRINERKRRMHRDMFACPGEDPSLCPERFPKEYINGTQTIIDAKECNKIENSFIFTGTKTDYDIITIQWIGFLLNNSTTYIRDCRENPNTGGDYTRVRPSTIHHGNWFVNKVANPESMQLYPDRENDAIRVWSGMPFLLRLIKGGYYYLDNENKSNSQQLVKTIMEQLKIAGYSKCDISEMVSNHFRPFNNGYIPGQKFTDLGICKYAELSLLDELIGHDEMMKFKTFLIGNRAYKGLRKWFICTKDGIITISVLCDRVEFTPEERDYWIRESDYLCVYCRRFTRQSSQYNFFVKKHADTLLAQGYSDNEAIKLASKYVDSEFKVLDDIALDHADITAREGKNIGLGSCTPCNSKKGNKTHAEFLKSALGIS